MKSHFNGSVDSVLLKEAKDKNWNISELTEQAIRDKLNAPKVEEVLCCEFCGNKGEKETGDDALECERKAKRENKEGKALQFADKTKLIWLYNYQQWICNSCLNNLIRKIQSN